MRQKITILATLILMNFNSFGQMHSDSTENKNGDLVMTIRGFDFLKSDGITEGGHLNNPEILDTLYNYLIINKDVNVQLRFNASCGEKSETYFYYWTKKVANICANYLISKGIDQSRLTFIGMGNKNLLEKCKCGECSREQMNINRRLDVIKLQNE